MGGDGAGVVAHHQLDGAFAEVEHGTAQLLESGCGRGRAENGFGVLEAGVAAERNVQKAEHREQADHALNEPSADVTEAEHGAIVEGPAKN
jgi:hypothetical protein